MEAKQAAGKSPYTIRNYRVSFGKLNDHLLNDPQLADPQLADIDADTLIGFFAWLQAKRMFPCDHAVRVTQNVFSSVVQPSS